MRSAFFLAALYLNGCSGLKPVNTYTPPDDSAADSGTFFGDLYLSPAEVDFGDVTVDGTSSADILLRNDGDAALNVTDTLVTGDKTFSIASVVSLPMELQPADEVLVTLEFTPTAAVDFAGNFRLAVSGQDDYAAVPLSGAGVEEGGDEGGGNEGGSGGGDEGITLSVASINFGTVDINKSSSQDVLITNKGSTDILITDLDSNNPVFTASGFSTPAVISAGGAKTMTVTFAPEDEGTTSGTITVVTDPAEYNESISVTGNGYLSCVICEPVIGVDTGGTDPYSMSFAFSTIGGTYSQTQKLVISNYGDEDLVITEFNLTNDTIATCGDFSSDWGGKPTTITGAGSTTVSVTYTVVSSCLELPSSILDTNRIHILSNDTDEPDYIVGLKATVL